MKHGVHTHTYMGPTIRTSRLKDVLPVANSTISNSNKKLIKI